MYHEDDAAIVRTYVGSQHKKLFIGNRLILPEKPKIGFKDMWKVIKGTQAP